jgi:peptidoglycan/LPS O-acetylase OafA/YrhL
MVEQEKAYRPDIDGLRAISIFLVVAYHANPWLIPGGFVGVDIFFVISGFLITRIILSEIASHRFSIARFYGRRVRRIFPALIVVLAVSYAIGWLVLLPNQLELFGKNIIAGVAFAANLFQISQTGYFAPNAANNPLLHLWSLGVEEQFYIFWPPILLLVAASTRLRLWLCLLTLISFCSAVGVFGHKDWSFYSPIARAWELLVGCFLAELSLSKRLPAIPENLASASGLIAILVAAIMLNGDRLFAGTYALLPVGGAALILMSPASFVNRLLLSTRPFVQIGLISYPLYLWHWPLLSYLDMLRGGVPNVLEIWGTIVVATVLSALTYRFIELPLRRRAGIVPILSAALATIGAFGIAAVVTAGFEFRFPREILEIARIRGTEDNPAFRDHCFLYAEGSAFDASCVGPGNKPLLFLWGDSTAAALYPALKDAEEKLGRFRLARFGAPACAPILDGGTNSRCDEANRKVFDFVVSSHPDVMLLHAKWGRSTDLERLRATIHTLRGHGVQRIVLLGPVPVWKRTLPLSLINAYRFTHELPDRIGIGVSGPEEDQMMEVFSKGEGIEYVSARKVLCDPSGCLTKVGAAPSDVLATDNVHLSEQGSKFLVAAIGKDL